MFYNRTEELKKIKTSINGNKKAVLLLYGKRRVGKSALVKEAIKE